jgi:ribosomal protein L35
LAKSEPVDPSIIRQSHGKRVQLKATDEKLMDAFINRQHNCFHRTTQRKRDTHPKFIQSMGIMPHLLKMDVLLNPPVKPL